MWIEFNHAASGCFNPATDRTNEWNSVFIRDNWKIYVNLLASICESDTKFYLRDIQTFIDSFIWLNKFETETKSRYSLDRKLISEKHGWQVKFPTNWNVVKMEETEGQFDVTAFVTEHRVFGQNGSTTLQVRRLKVLPDQSLVNWSDYRLALYKLLNNPDEVTVEIAFTNLDKGNDLSVHTTMLNNNSYVEILHIDLDMARYEVIARTTGPNFEVAGEWQSIKSFGNGDDRSRQLVNDLVLSFGLAESLDQDSQKVGDFIGLVIDPYMKGNQDTTRRLELSLLEEASSLTGSIKITGPDFEIREGIVSGSLSGDYVDFLAVIPDAPLNNSGTPMDNIHFTGLIGGDELIRGEYRVGDETQSNAWVAAKPCGCEFSAQ